jgi:ABC-type polysaccharide/polyol phosphate export permease
MAAATWQELARMDDRRLEERIIRAPHSLAPAERLSPVRWAALLSQDLQRLARFNHFLRRLVITELRLRYQRSILGFFWTLLNPILMMGVLALVFSQVMRIEMKQYALYLFSGMIPWRFFQSAVTSGGGSLLANESLIKKVEVPKFLFPLNCLLVAGVNMIFELAALFILFAALGATIHVQLVLLPVAILMLGSFSLGITLVAVTLVSRYRDFEHIIAVFMQLIYFLCPILYPPEFLERYPFLLTWNPMAYLLAPFQAALYYGTWPDAGTWCAAAIVAVATLIIGYLVYKRSEPNYVFWL